MIDQVNSQFTFVVKKTNELSEEEIDEINKLFNEIFNINSQTLRTKEELFFCMNWVFSANIGLTPRRIKSDTSFLRDTIDAIAGFISSTSLALK